MAVISETELQRRLRVLERKSLVRDSALSDKDPVNANHAEGDTHYNTVTGNLWVFRNGTWSIAPDVLHIRYADTVTNIGADNKAASQADVTGFSAQAFNAAGVQKAFRGLWWGGDVASTSSTAYEWFNVATATATLMERYWANSSAMLVDVGNPDKPGANVAWTSLAAGASIPAASFWIAERFKAGGVWTPWQIYPTQADNNGIPFIKYSKTGSAAPTLGDSAWISDVVEAATAQTGLTFSNQKELGYGTVVVIDYASSVTISGQFKRQSGTDVWVAPSKFIDGNVIVDGSLTADHLQANTIDASVIKVTGTNAVTASTFGAVEATDIFTTGTTTIDGGKITTGSISATDITTGTMNADRISGGTINGVLIDGVAITGGTIGIGSGGTTGGFNTEVNSQGFLQADNLVVQGQSFVFGNSNLLNAALKVSNAGTGPAIWGVNSHSTNGVHQHGIRGQHTSVTHTSGLVGPANAYSFYAEHGAGYGPFTGSHDALIPTGTLIPFGDIVIDHSCISKTDISNTIFKVVRSSSPNQKAAVGVLVHNNGLLVNGYPPSAFVVSRDIDEDTEEEVITYTSAWDLVKNTYDAVIMNSIGEGQINVIGEGGNLEAGDLIVTSSTAGKGMKQSDDIVRSYTVAKVREDVTFTSLTEEKLVACIYLCG